MSEAIIFPPHFRFSLVMKSWSPGAVCEARHFYRALCWSVCPVSSSLTPLSYWDSRVTAGLILGVAMRGCPACARRWVCGVSAEAITTLLAAEPTVCCRLSTSAGWPSVLLTQRDHQRRGKLRKVDTVSGRDGWEMPSLPHAGCAEVAVPFCCQEQSLVSGTWCSGIHCPAHHTFHWYSHSQRSRLLHLKLFISPCCGVWKDSQIPCLLNEVSSHQAEPSKGRAAFAIHRAPPPCKYFLFGAAQTWHLCHYSDTGQVERKQIALNMKANTDSLLTSPLLLPQQWIIIEMIRDAVPGKKEALSVSSLRQVTEDTWQLCSVLCPSGMLCWGWGEGGEELPGWERVLCRHMHFLSLDLLLGHCLARIARGFFFKFNLILFFWKFYSVSSLGFSCYLERRSVFKTCDFLVL